MEKTSSKYLAKWTKGLGPNSWGRWRKLLPYNKRFYIASVAHDVAYTRWWNSKDKIRADRLFLKINLANCDTFLQATFAFIYYMMVSRFGSTYFNYK